MDKLRDPLSVASACKQTCNSKVFVSKRHSNHHLQFLLLLHDRGKCTTTHRCPNPNMHRDSSAAASIRNCDIFTGLSFFLFLLCAHLVAVFAFVVQYPRQNASWLTSNSQPSKRFPDEEGRLTQLVRVCSFDMPIIHNRYCIIELSH